MLLLGTVGAAFGLAFALEFYLDRSIKRAAEVEAKLGLPLFLTIPRMIRNGKAKQLKGKTVPLNQLKGTKPMPLLPERASASREIGAGGGAPPPSEDLPVIAPAGNDSPAPWESSHALHAFWDALRDRLITYFELKNLTHKPKLVALTSCASGSGVSTIASGLAASLSETGEGNVLLVEMNTAQGSAHQFSKGKLTCGLDDALEADKRDNALVQENLYVVKESTNGAKVPRVLPKRFNDLVPRLKASDYDYIIFDMPPVSQISVTPRLARFMDMVLMVVESEKTDQDVVKKATSWLTESKANVGIVLNKSKSYVPKRLHQEL
jgi:Mrp family chromosome partitioning ATPase